MLSCTSVCWCLVVTCWEKADLLALVCDVLLWRCHFPTGILFRCSAWLYRFLIFAFFLTLTMNCREQKMYSTLYVLYMFDPLIDTILTAFTYMQRSDDKTSDLKQAYYNTVICWLHWNFNERLSLRNSISLQLMEKLELFSIWKPGWKQWEYFGLYQLHS